MTTSQFPGRTHKAQVCSDLQSAVEFALVLLLSERDSSHSCFHFLLLLPEPQPEAKQSANRYDETDDLERTFDATHRIAEEIAARAHDQRPAYGAGGVENEKGTAIRIGPPPPLAPPRRAGRRRSGRRTRSSRRDVRRGSGRARADLA